MTNKQTNEQKRTDGQPDKKQTSGPPKLVVSL